MVSFSGGLDSSAVLALAAFTARERGLPEPIPVTLRFPDVASTEESSWQELMVAHLGLADWQRIDIGGELDFLGDVACLGLAEHGLLWPANSHVHVPVLQRARGGSVLTGFDGDGLFYGWNVAHVMSVLGGHRPVALRDPLRLGLAFAPAPLRRAIIATRINPWVEWLWPEAERALRARLAADRVSEPRRWDHRLSWYARQRYLKLATEALSLLGTRHQVKVHHPFLDPGFLHALARHGGRTGYADRASAIGAHLGDLLPPTLLARASKAEFGAAFWGERARAFAAAWDGGGVDPALVNPEALRRTWAQKNPPLGAATVLQGAWLASRA